jgi:glycosyltransferase involved in cell wall biosynthesis
MTLRSLTVFFPMLNEAGNVEKLIAQLDDFIPSMGTVQLEILFLDGGSTDGSDKIIENWCTAHPFARVVREPQRMKYAMALRTGFHVAGGEAVFYTDSDLPVDLMDVHRTLPLLQSADIVIGYRVDRQETFRRAVFSKIYNALIRRFFDVNVRDVNFSFKLVSRPALDAIRLDAHTGFIDGQLLAEARRCGFRIAEIPVDYTPRKTGVSSFDNFSTAWDILMEILRYRQHRRRDDR